MTEIDRTPFEQMSARYGWLGQDWVRHFVCETEVNEPTISVVQAGERRVVAIQWFSEAIAGDLPIGTQTRFHVGTSADNILWFGRPEDFRVLFMGRIRDWPRSEAVLGLASELAYGNQDAWVALIVNTGIMVGDDINRHPHAFACPLILVGDQEAGLLVAPEKYNRNLAQITEPEPHFVLPKTKR